MTQQPLIHAVYFLVLYNFALRTAWSCASSEFECSDASCIDSSKRCDNDFDCDTGTSDEENCSSLDVCVEGQIRCPDGSCATTLDVCPFTTEEQADVTTEQQGNDNRNQDNENRNQDNGKNDIYIACITPFLLYGAISILVLVLFITGNTWLIQKCLNGISRFLSWLRNICKPKGNKIATGENMSTKGDTHKVKDLNFNDGQTSTIPNGNIPPKSTKPPTAHRESV